MPARVLFAAALLLSTAMVSGCTGGSDGEADATPSGTAAVEASADASAGTEASAAASPAAAGETVTSVEIGDLVCSALAAIVADNEATPYIPEAAIAQFTLKTLGSSDGAAYPAIIAGADTAAQAQCPADRDAVLAIAEKDSLTAMLSGG